jgi:hypothetical protein
MLIRLLNGIFYSITMSRYGNGKKDKVNVFALTIYKQLVLFSGKIGLLNHYIDRVVKDIELRVEGMKFHIVDIESLYLLSSNYEPWNMKHLLRLLKMGDVFLDVGSHIGKYTVPAAKKSWRRRMCNIHRGTP